MTDCQRVCELMMTALDAEGVNSLPESAAAHLAGCASCRALWEELQALEKELIQSAAEPIKTSATLHAGIMKRLAGENLPQVRATWHRWIGAALAAAVLALIGFLVAQRLKNH